MGIQRTENLIHWNYFLALEEDLERLSRFVDFAANDATYSLEIARLLLGACAEVDVVLKQLCRRISAAAEADSLAAYYPLVTQEFPDFQDFEVQLPRLGMHLTPWVDWEQHSAPLWWSDHNKVKHSRHEHFDRATLKNCLNSMGGLYIAVLHLYGDQAEQGELLQHPRMFNVADAHFAGNRQGRFGSSFVYRLTPKGEEGD